MKYFFDTEFIDHKGGIDLISIGIVREDGKEFYAISTEFKPRRADKWVKENVIAKLPERYPNPNYGSPNWREKALAWKKLSEIKQGILEFVGDDEDPEFYAYFADYDWVVFCRNLFGRMIDLPRHFPMWCRDLKQMMWERNLDKEWKRLAVPDNENEHDALDDARWNLQLYKKIMAVSTTPTKEEKTV
jgi:hypothetical protein